jgi:hypothetical protein
MCSRASSACAAENLPPGSAFNKELMKALQSAVSLRHLCNSLIDAIAASRSQNLLMTLKMDCLSSLLNGFFPKRSSSIDTPTDQTSAFEEQDVLSLTTSGAM